MQFLKIENPGVAPVECFTVLGCSTSRFSGNDDVSGQFGSGLKHAVNILLAQGYRFYIYCGKTCLEFFLEDMPVDDGITSHTFKKVMCKIGSKTKDLGWTLDHGSLDWKNVSMACREFVSNAMDRCTKEGTKPNIALVEEKSVRAKDGFTRIFLGFESGVITFYSELNKRFLNIEAKTPLGVLPKAARNINGEGAMLYRKGVLVRESDSHTKSLFDYNMGEELYIDECRNANESDLLYGATINLLTRSTESQKIAFIRHLISDKEEALWEDGITRHSATTIVNYNVNKLEPHKAAWKNAWDKIVQKGTILTNVIIPKQTLVRLGLNPVFCNSHGWFVLANYLGFNTSDNSLSDDEKEGREFSEPTSDTMNEVHRVWEWMKTKGLTKEFEFPEVKIFSQHISNTEGEYKDGTIYINKEIEGKSERLTSVILEELTHYVTGFEDYCYNLQTFLFNTLAKEIK